MSEIYLVDYYANTIKSPFHQRQVLAKLVFLFLILFSIILSKSISHLIFIFFIITILTSLAHLPTFKILTWTLYPAFFASIFALSQIQKGFFLPLQTIFRAIDAALLTLFIVCTTSYPAIFSLFGRISPLLVNILFFAYRYFFLLLDEVETKIKAIKLRGGFAGGTINTLKNMGSAIGYLFLRSIEKSEKIYEALIRRGYQGKFFSPAGRQFQFIDLILILIGVLIFTISI